jgi:hypothetical protein
VVHVSPPSLLIASLGLCISIVLALRWKRYRDGQALLAVLPIIGISLPYAWPHALLYTAPAFVFVIWKFCLLFPAPLRGLAARILLYPLPLIAILELVRPLAIDSWLVILPIGLILGCLLPTHRLGEKERAV